MNSDTDKVKAKVANLDQSLTLLEQQLDPLFHKSLPESLLPLEPLQQAKLQTLLPYVVYDLVFGTPSCDSSLLF